MQQGSDVPWSVGVRLARQEIAAGASPKREAQLRLIYGEDLLTGGERRELGFERAARMLEGFVAEHGRQPKDREMIDGFNLGHWVTNRRQEREKLPADRVARLESIPGWSWGVAHAAAFEDGYARLVAFVAEHGRQPKDREVVHGFNLGTWVARRRTEHEKLSADRLARLEQVPGWTWDTRVAAFEDGYARLLAFVTERGRQPRATEVVDGFNLGAWVANRRSKREQLSADRLARLEAVPGWTWDAQAAAFEDGYARLVAFVTERGRQPTQREVVDGFNLGTWVAYRRSEREKLPADQVTRLEQVPGWTWGPRGAAFDDGYARLVEFVTERGRLPKDREVVDGFNLGTWVANRRSEHGKLSPDRVARLEAVPGWSWGVSLADRFEDGYARLLEFVAEHGRLPRKREMVDGFPLGQWVVSRRHDYRVSTLAPDRAARLESVPGWSWGRPAAVPPA